MFDRYHHLTVFSSSFIGVKEFVQGLALYLNGAHNSELIMDNHAGTSENCNDLL